MIRAGRAAVIACGLLMGCVRGPVHPVERVEISGPTVADNAILGLDPEGVRALFRERLVANKHFLLLAEGTRGKGQAPVTLTLELAFTREAQKDGRAGTYAEVGASVTVKRSGPEGSSKHEVVGLGEVPEQGEGTTARREAVRKALEAALDQAAAATHLQIWALEKTDQDLMADLGNTDLRAREFAIRELAERRNPAVSDALLERVKGSDPDEVRRAMGGLVELRERRAVPLLIETARGKDLAFLREVLFALGEIGGDDAEAYLYTIAQGHDQPAIRDAAKQALEELAGRKNRPGPPSSDNRRPAPDGRAE